MEKWKIVPTKLLHDVHISQPMFFSRECVLLPWGFLGKGTLLWPLLRPKSPEPSLMESLEWISSFPRQSREARNVYWSIENGKTKRLPSLAVPNPCGIVRKNGLWEQLSWTSPAEILVPIINFKAGIPCGVGSWRVGRFSTFGDIWSYLETFLVVTAGERGQDIVKHHKAKDPWRIYDPELSAEAEKPYSRRVPSRWH